MELQYNPTTLRTIRAEMKNNYEMTNIDVATRTWIITLGIHKWISYGPYWRSKVGARLSHWIHTIHRSNVPTQMGQLDCNQPHTP